VDGLCARSGDLANFFSDHYGLDLRYLLFAVAALLFGATWIHYKVWRAHRQMPLLLACFLHALFVWFAENVGTFTRAWAYPHQLAGWSPVPVAKLGSWFLLLIISYALVALVNRPRDVEERVSLRKFADTPIPGL
jgi:uncharacterized membrane protein YoaT (DUF817 family)